jgi:hypothetical protein
LNVSEKTEFERKMNSIRIVSENGGKREANKNITKSIVENR